MEFDGVVVVEDGVCLSRHPKNRPGVSQEYVDDEVVEAGGKDVEEVLSLQPPKKPGCWHDVLVEVADADGGARVTDGAGAGVTKVFVFVVGSLHPNHPGVSQVVVVDVVDEVVAVAVVAVVVSSKQPHQPGVLHVVVRVRVDEDELEDVVVLSEPLLSKYFQLKQS